MLPFPHSAKGASGDGGAGALIARRSKEWGRISDGERKEEENAVRAWNADATDEGNEGRRILHHSSQPSAYDNARWKEQEKRRQKRGRTGRQGGHANVALTLCLPAR